MDRIREHFQQLVDIGDHDWAIFSSKLVRSEHPKKARLVKVGQVEKHLSFIEKGAVRFFVPGEENDLTFVFRFENEFVSAYDSFISQQPCFYEVQTLAPTTLWRITHDDLQEIYQNTEVGNTIGRLTAEHLYMMKSEREQALLNQTAEERYLALFTRQPKLIREIPLKHIASYIGITPQALSRIRRRIS